MLLIDFKMAAELREGEGEGGREREGGREGRREGERGR